MSYFKLISKFKPTKDQEKAISSLVRGRNNGLKYQVLLGVTGSGKTFTAANVIERLQKPALIISHNKTLAAQLYQEFRDFFPDNAVSYFVSYYDYYQPEAYIPATDTYIEKDAGINELIDKLRLAATTNLLTRNDTIVVASVSCIYNLGSPREYGHFVFEFKRGQKIGREEIIEKLVDLQYERGDFGFTRGTFRVRGDTIDIYPAYQDEGMRIELDGNRIVRVKEINTITGEILIRKPKSTFILYPSKHYMTDPGKQLDTFKKIEKDLKDRVGYFSKKGKFLEANRIKQKVTYDLEMIKEVGYVKGIENYSRYFDGREKGEPPFTLLDYYIEPFGKDWLVFVDESHITFPQIRGMYAGDQSRKKTLIEYGFRLPSAMDNRPLTFDEFMRRIPGFIATSATPGDFELGFAGYPSTSIRKKRPVEKLYRIGQKSQDKRKIGVVEQLLRPTGIPDPEVFIKPVSIQVKDVIQEIEKQLVKKQRTLVTTLTKRTAEDLSGYLEEKGMKVHYLHSDVKTLERSDILDNLRRGRYDVLVGVNLLREGLDLPEVSLVAILDADKEGFLRSEVSLIQTMGRAARHVEGRVILYADNITGSINKALYEIDRRRKYQVYMNRKYKVKPTSIQKPYRERLVEKEEEGEFDKLIKFDKNRSFKLPDFDVESLTPLDKVKLTSYLKKEMKFAAQGLNFELAAEIRDKIKELETD